MARTHGIPAVFGCDSLPYVAAGTPIGVDGRLGTVFIDPGADIIARLIAAAQAVGVCGEAAAEPDLIPVLIKLGVTELSMSPAAILHGKKTISEC
ncbi:hypothetical protein AiwAL_05495 [Acidiphilium sp. AL]|uniref:putative PEP-binding protein n=1 Tax=Acidiphilium sp. AL TaxID=2871704 RepID=UPI0021CAF07C|nr:putative PEP-binding protein [Acidiphilium sp. AL]MCU4159555.1 hypothetical protein [Acidiphilium sp. AL]